MATASAPTIDAILAASDGIVPNEDFLSARRASEPCTPFNEVTPVRDNLEDGPAGVPARETLEGLGVSPSEDIDDRSEVYSDDVRRNSDVNGENASIGGERWPWMSSFGDRFTTFILTNIGIVNEPELTDSFSKELSSVTPDDADIGDSTKLQGAEDTSPQDS